MSEDQAVKLEGVHGKSAIISIVDTCRVEPNSPFAKPPELSEWTHKLQLAFDDVDVNKDPEEAFNCGYTPMSIQDAESIIGFICGLPPEVETIVVHCAAGISRSGGVARFIAEVTKADFPMDYDLHNEYVYGNLWHVWSQSGIAD